VKPAAFAYHRPATRAEALDVLGEYGEEAKVLAGGQSLVPAMNMRLARPARLVDVNRLDELTLAVDGDALAVGALVRQNDVLTSALVRDRVPLLAHALPFVGHWQTRSRGTLCGSLAHADPSAELPVVASALDATIECASRAGVRVLGAAAFFVAHFTTALAPDELVVRARFPIRHGRDGYAFDEFAERHGDFAIVSAACALRLADGDDTLAALRLVIGGVGEVPFVLDVTEHVGRRLDDEAVTSLADRAGHDIEPFGDHRASAEYRRNLASVLARRVLRAAAHDARKEPA
jgi:CO/xanthine dehydrogenase FAD-binding subunit